jgi:diadenosine tetraphosphate (Ap4A) HIT family hydrolase
VYLDNVYKNVSLIKCASRGTKKFEKIISREILSNIISENDIAVIIYDIHPQAPVHALIIPKKELIRLKPLKMVRLNCLQDY